MEELLLNPFDIFQSGQETFADAQQKKADEAPRKKVGHFVFKTGASRVRVLPLAPTKQADGTYVLDRKGYEYPLKSLVLSINKPSDDGKSKPIFVGVCHGRSAGLSVDLIETYLEALEDKYADDEKLVKKARSGSFEGGLKWNYQRCMYILDMDNRGEGIKLASISYAQYNKLEEAKLLSWGKIVKNNPKAACPISSTNEAFAVDVMRTENGSGKMKKTEYSFALDILSGTIPLTTEELQSLLEAPRIPEVIYRYNRYHLGATIEYLKQYDEKYGIDVLSTPAVQDAINKIKAELPASDTSRFSFGDNPESGNTETNEITFEAIKERFEEMRKKGLADDTQENVEIRELIRKYVDSNGLEVRVNRHKTTEDLLIEIEEAGFEEVKSEMLTEEDDENDAENEPQTEEVEDEAAEEVEEEVRERPSRPARRRVEL